MSSKDSIWKGIIHMGLGTILAQMINVLAQPVLTRLFPAATLGVYTYLVSMATIVIPIASLKLDMLIVSEPDDTEAQYITDSCIIVNIAIAVLYGVVILIAYFLPGDNVFNKYGLMILVIPILVLTNGLRFLFISYLNRYKKYKMISVIAILREGIRAVIQVVAGALSLGAVSLSMGYAISPLFGLNIQTKEYIQKLKLRPRLTIEKFKHIVLNKGRRQILYLVPAQFVNSFSASLITISITALFSAQVLGFYSAGARILDIPLIFITSNVSKVCYQKISENVSNQKPVLKLLISVIVVLSVISVVGFGILYVIAPPLAEIVFGNGYSVAGEYIRCLCAMYAIRMVATSFAGVYTVFNKQNFELLFNILLILMAGLSYIVCSSMGLRVSTYLWLINIGYTFVYAIMLLGYIVLCLKYDKELGE